MTWVSIVSLTVIAFVHWHRSKRQSERVASLELRLWNLRQEHDALLIILGERTDETPRVLS